jgi:hypothetical protein
MKTKLIAMVLGVALVVATAMFVMAIEMVATIIPQASAVGDSGGVKGINGEALLHAGGGPHGLDQACLHSQNNPHCGQTPTGQAEGHQSIKHF